MKIIVSKLSLLKNIDLNKLWITFFIIVFTGTLYACIFNSRYKFNPVLLICLILLFIILITKLYRKFTKSSEDFSNKKTWIFYTIITLIMVVLEFVIGYLVRTDPSWDLGIVIKSAQEIIQYGHSTTQSGYYIQAPNNIVITLIIAFSLKFFSFFNLHNVNIITLFVNICFIQLAIFFTFKIIKKLFNNRTACFSLILLFLFLPLYPFATFCYTDTTSMFIPVAILYLLIKFDNLENVKSKIIYSIILGGLCFIAFGLKVTALIILVAYIIISLFDRTLIKKLKYLAIAFLTFFIIFKGYVFFINKTKIINMNYKETQVVPFTHFIMMGMTGSGAFSADEWQYTFSLEPTERKAAHLNVIKSRLSKYKTQGYIKFLNQKMTNQTWGDGTFDFETILGSYNIDNNIAHQFLLETGKYFAIVFYYCQAYHFSMLICILLLFMYSLRKDSNKYIKVCQLSLLGLLIFLMLWETRSRYMLNYIPVYVILFVSGIDTLSKNYKKILNLIFIKNNKA